MTAQVALGMYRMGLVKKYMLELLRTEDSDSDSDEDEGPDEVEAVFYALNALQPMLQLPFEPSPSLYAHLAKKDVNDDALYEIASAVLHKTSSVAGICEALCHSEIWLEYLKHKHPEMYLSYEEERARISGTYADFLVGVPEDIFDSLGIRDLAELVSKQRQRRLDTLREPSVQLTREWLRDPAHAFFTL